jgi:hypothetical protein
VILPLVVTIVAFLFAAILLRQFARRGRPYQLVWTIALSMGGLAALFFVLFLDNGRNEAFFRLYYIFGGLLMAAYLGLGSIYLLAPRRLANLAATIVMLLSVAGIVLLLTAHVDHAVLRGSNVEAGSNAVSGASVAFIVVLNTFGAVAVIGGALYSAYRLLRRQGPVQLLAANVLIAAGTILASLAGALARTTGNGSAFWAMLAAGFVVLFAGFLLTLARTSPRPAVRQAG